MDYWWFRYVQFRGGRKLHMAEAFMGGRVAATALCGFSPGHWGTSFNFPMAYACKNCTRVYLARGINGAVAQ